YIAVFNRAGRGDIAPYIWVIVAPSDADVVLAGRAVRLGHGVDGYLFDRHGPPSISWRQDDGSYPYVEGLEVGHRALVAYARRLAGIGVDPLTVPAPRGLPDATRGRLADPGASVTKS